MLKVLLSSPGVGYFVQQVALAMLERGLLGRYATTIAAGVHEKRFHWMPASVTSRRNVSLVPGEYLSTWPYRELVRMVGARLDRSGVLSDILWEWSEKGFDRWVSRSHVASFDAVYGYEHACLETLTRAKELGKTTIYDVPAPEHDYVNDLLAREAEKYPELSSAYLRRGRARQQQRTKRRRKEWDLADIVFANSEFTLNSYRQSGYDVSKVRVVPLAAPIPVNEVDVIDSPANTLRVIYAGTYSIRKGAHYLCEAWRKLGNRNNVILDVYGSNQLPASMTRDLPDNVVFHGSVERSVLEAAYRRSDVLLFPTLCDGFGLVVAEAMANGVPVITTGEAGASMLVEHGRNGIIIRAADAQAIVDAVSWCQDNRVELREMGQQALVKARAWQWPDYRNMFSEVLEDALLGSRVS